MGVDAIVYCDCLERGRLRASPPARWDVGVGVYGARFARTTSRDEHAQFEQWNVAACDHGHGVWLHHHLGDAARVGAVRWALSPYPDLFPIILGKIVHNAAHTGDFLTPDQVEALGPELEALPHVYPDDGWEARCLRYFDRQLTELVAASLRLRKPISF